MFEVSFPLHLHKQSNHVVAGAQQPPETAPCLYYAERQNQTNPRTVCLTVNRLNVVRCLILGLLQSVWTEVPMASPGELTWKTTALLWPGACCQCMSTLGSRVYHLISSLDHRCAFGFKMLLYEF